jgi:S-adenosylmethionine-diacylgycerolhomoserine-N-methlytransferase
MNVLAAEAMDRMYRRQRHVYDVTRKYYLLGRDRLIKNLRPMPGDGVLEIGCGTGRNLIGATRLYPQARFFGLDISREMLATAQAAIARAGLSARIVLAQGDATAFDPAALFGEQQFARVFISYSLSMIPAWPAVLKGAAGCVARGGELHVVDFGEQEGLPHWFRAALRGWLARFGVHPRAELECEMAALANGGGARLTFTRPCRGYAQYGVVHFSG